RAVRAGAEDLQRVGHVDEAVLGRDALRPALHRRAFDLHRAPARAADEMVVVAAAAPAVDGLALGGAQHVHLARVGERLERPVDGGEADRVAPVLEQVVQLLCAAEVVHLGQHGGDCRPLAGGAPGGGRRVGAGHLGISSGAGRSAGGCSIVPVPRTVDGGETDAVKTGSLRYSGRVARRAADPPVTDRFVVPEESTVAADKIETIVSLSKRRGFVYPCSEIYGGQRAAWDYGPLGVELKENIKRQWWRAMVTSREDVVGLDSS